MTPPDSAPQERRRGTDRRQTPTGRGLTGWLAEAVHWSRGWLLMCVVVSFWFAGLAIYSGLHIVEGLRREDCRAANLVRSNAAAVALEDVDADRAIWLAIDELFDDGIPEPARSTIFLTLGNREALIQKTYSPQPCGGGEP